MYTLGAVNKCSWGPKPSQVPGSDCLWPGAGLSLCCASWPRLRLSIWKKSPHTTASMWQRLARLGSGAYRHQFATDKCCLSQSSLSLSCYLMIFFLPLFPSPFPVLLSVSEVASMETAYMCGRCLGFSDGLTVCVSLQTTTSEVPNCRVPLSHHQTTWGSIDSRL